MQHTQDWKLSSLSDEGVAEFTALAALTAKATKSTASEMTSLFATGYGIYKVDEGDGFGVPESLLQLHLLSGVHCLTELAPKLFKGEQVLTKVASWIEENKELVKIIMLIVLAIGGFLMR